MAALELDDATIWYEETGSGEPIVFVHGGWMNADAWTRQVERFAGDYRVVTLDLRGHGRTGATDARRYTVDLYVDDVERLLDHLGLENIVICGLSLGNIVTQEFLNRHPERLDAAILGGPARSMPPWDVPGWLKRFSYPELGIRTSLNLTGTKSTFRTMLGSIRTTTGQPWISVDPEIRAQAIEAAGDIPRAEYEKIFSALYRYDPPELSHVATPTMAIYGENESCFVKQQGRQIARDVADGAVRSIPDAAHLVNMDNPEAFNAAVAEFLGGVDAAA